MFREQPDCAICGQGVAPDSDHVEVEVEHVRMKDRNEVEDRYFHARCWEAVGGSWRRP